MTEKAAGSIWNPNSWHWEMKNYTAVAKPLVEEKLLGMEIKEGGISIISTKVSFDKADAEINIRKGKQYLVYEFELDVHFRAEDDTDEASGTYIVKDINNDDLEDIVIEDLKTDEKTEFADKAKNVLRKHLKQNIICSFKNFAEQLAKIESDPKKLEEDRRKREEAQAATLKAKQQKGWLKEKLLQQQRQKEKKMKEDFSKWGKKDQEPTTKEG